MDRSTASLATRTLELQGKPSVIVELSVPVPHGDDFECSYKIQGLGAEETKCAFGVDGLQALLLAMQRIGIDLYTSEAFQSGQLRWLGQPDLGFPVPETVRDLVPKSNP